MITQLNHLKCMLVRNKAWENEVEKKLGSPANATDVGNRIHKYASLEDLHPTPRITIKSGSWSTDQHHGSCLETSSQQMTIELERDAPEDNATALENQYEEVCGVIAEICNELTRASYGENNYDGGEYLAELLVECGEVVLDDIVENKIEDPETTTTKVIWWCNIHITPRSR